MNVLKLILILLIEETFCKCTLHVQKANIEFDPEYLNVTWDSRNFLNPPEFPFDYTPEPTLVALKDLKQLAVFIMIKRRHEPAPLAIQKISLCSGGGARSGIIKPLLQAILEIGKVNLRCNLKKRSKLTFKTFRLRDLFLVKLLRSCKKMLDDFELKILEDKKRPHYLFNATLMMELTEVPK